MSSLSTHVLDAVRGVPAAGIAVSLFDAAGRQLASVATDGDGRIGGLGGELPPGTYRLRFASGEYFSDRRMENFYPEVSIAFAVTDERHYHVPLLLSPFAYSTYRGS